MRSRKPVETCSNFYSAPSSPPLAFALLFNASYRFVHDASSITKNRQAGSENLLTIDRLYRVFFCDGAQSRSSTRITAVLDTYVSDSFTTDNLLRSLPLGETQERLLVSRRAPYRLCMSGVPLKPVAIPDCVAESLSMSLPALRILPPASCAALCPEPLLLTPRNHNLVLGPAPVPLNRILSWPRDPSAFSHRRTARVHSTT